ncbi:hypothetical protein HN766_20455 [Candidatus Poribacteria bacterium]|nr:hypothetical protein [Candidatus Poribacteria bacterium]
MRSTTASMLALTLFITAMASAQDGNVEAHGFVVTHGAGRLRGTGSDGAPTGDFLIREDRFRLDLEGWSEDIDAEIKVKAEVVHDALARRLAADLREAYIDYATGDLDFRIGRQVITWGVGDLIFVSDVWPKDWVSFFAGRPMDYFKVGIEAVRARLWSDVVNVEVVAATPFEPDTLPDSALFGVANPFAGVESVRVEMPRVGYGNVEFAAKVSRKALGLDLAAHAYRGFWSTPSARTNAATPPTSVTMFYPALSVYTLTAQTNAAGGVISAEAGLYDSRDDRDGSDLATPNSQIRGLVGYDRPLWSDARVGAQYYVELMDDFGAYEGALPPGFPSESEYRDMVTLRLEQMLRRQTLRLSLFAFYSPADSDYLVQPTAEYKLSDELRVAVGADLFGGDAHTMLGRFDRSDNVHATARFDF